MAPQITTRSSVEVATTPVLSNDIETVDLIEANIVASGANKKTVRVVNGLGSLMGSKEITQLDDSITAKVQPSTTTSGEKLHISEQPWTLNNWHQHINWLNMVLTVFIPAIGFYFALSGKVPVRKNVVLFALFYYVASGITITAGYHRLWSHRAFEARWPLRLFFAILGAANVQGSIKWWGHSHRIHHRYTDTPRDPYDARRGLWYSHMGWMLMKPNPKYKARADISDLNDDWIVRFQHRHYIPIMILTAFVFPTWVVGKYISPGDYMAGFIYAGILRVFAIQQATFCINSLAHFLGDQPFDDKRTPRDNWITALVTFGEGYHNFHHEFPTDYRNAIKWYQYDPTKLFIYATSILGLALNLKTFDANVIQQGIVQQQEKKVNKMKNKLHWGPTLDELPVWDKKEFVEQAQLLSLIHI